MLFTCKTSPYLISFVFLNINIPTALAYKRIFNFYISHTNDSIALINKEI